MVVAVVVVVHVFVFVPIMCSPVIPLGGFTGKVEKRKWKEKEDCGH